MQEMDLLEEQAKLIERNKELSCLFEIAKIVANTSKTFPDILHSIVALLPAAFHYPESICARIRVDDFIFMTDNFEESVNTIQEILIIEGLPKGAIEVFYTGNKEVVENQGNCFLPEEYKLLNAIARQISLMIEMKLANEKQSKLEKQLLHADRLAKVGQLTAGLAHELNEPLAGILGFAQLAVKKIDKPEQAARYLDRIIQSCLHAREIIKKMMLFSSPVPHRKSLVDLNKTLEAGMSFIEPRFVKSNIKFECSFDPKLPSIMADPSQITQVLVNLAINAIQAMPEGGTLRIKTDTLGGKPRMIVQDTGMGMDSQTIEQIFLPFFSTKDVDQGMGLGLSVVHGIISAHGGTIDVQSQKGMGATFIIAFPAGLEEKNQLA